ncbi:TRAP transporter substrate-binding protein [Marinobacterium rhizophilum]|uniref:TRAP transporter substrate-binding protein n=1 Tax=Marinobacterium rhizophilum TaxID=420402 RepID=A0ABY5HHL3_9GAMM|nr:TRAP transporter substrate-binding protein [Marinobacterium rhizophilum]UTW11850.1 TRAP transporter substrate-binding protein [Marinobacterium rhizophilum]
MAKATPFSDKKPESVSRRDFFRVAATYGMSSTMLAATALGSFTLPQLTQAAEATANRRNKKEAKHTLKFGASGFNENNLLIERAGCLDFARDIEDRTDGEIRVEFIGDNQICGQLDCVKKTQQGIIDMFTASTQNSAGAAPYLNVLDYAYMFPTRASQYHFLYHPDSQRLLRDPLKKKHGLQFLFSHCELRGLQMGLGWQDKPLITDIDVLKGTKNRVTGTQLGRIAMQLLELNPVPIAWSETLDGLKSGLIDGAETWAGAVGYANMSPVISQSVDLRLFCGTEATMMDAKVFDSMSPALQEAVMESAYLTQVKIQAAQEAALVNTVGATVPSLAGTLFHEHNVRVAPLSDEVRAKAERICAPEFNPEPWVQWRERLDKWAGGIDTYTEIHKIAREIPLDTLAENVEPRRWWKNA